jgi:5-bromo-4-chloroindolyl phosphate hydrolysis protein
MKKEIKKIIFTILDKEPERVTEAELQFLFQHLTYELLEKYQKLTGQAIFIEGFNSEVETEEVINVSVLDLINLIKDLENTD